VTSKELRRLEIDELLAHADTGEPERVEAALELLRRRQAKQLRKQSRVRPQAQAHDSSHQSPARELARTPDTPRASP
jgi:hypothetical protein